jgi:hypothetical protein
MAVEYLVHDEKRTGHLPYTKEDGKPDHHLMGAAWAALHGGYRGNKYEGSDKEAALAKLKRVYKSEGMDTPSESSEAYSSYGSLQASAETPEEGKTHQALTDRGYQPSAVNSDGSSVWEKGNSTVHVRRDGSWIHGSSMGDSADALCTHFDGMTETHRRAFCAEVSPLQEAAYDPTKGLLTLTIIKPGFSKNITRLADGSRAQRYYPATTLKEAAPLFAGAKMFADHATEAEDRARPEGSVRNWVATVKKAWAESDGRVRGEAAIIDPGFKSKLEELQKQNLLSDMHVSIRAIGEASKGSIEGKPAAIVESITAARSVDFVTFGAAGGQLEILESEAEANDIDLVTEASLRQRRPDLVELIESHFEGDCMKTLETQLQEANTQLAAEKKRADEAESKIQEAEKTAKKAAAAVELTKLLTESKLPEKAQERLKKQFSEAVSTDGMKEAIEYEKEYIRSFGGSSKVTNMGARDAGTTSISEADRHKRRVEILKASGMSEKEAEIAARGR